MVKGRGLVLAELLLHDGAMGRRARRNYSVEWPENGKRPERGRGKGKERIGLRLACIFLFTYVACSTAGMRSGRGSNNLLLMGQ